MAGEQVYGKRTDHPETANEKVRQQFSALVDDVEAIRAALGLSAGFVTSAPGLAIGTSSAAEVANDEFTVVVRGETITVAAGETGFTATTDDIADPDTDPREAYYVLSVDSAGALTITKGATAAEDAAVKPAAPAGEVVVGYVKIQHDGSAIFDATTNDLDAAHLTVTYEDAPTLAAADLTAAKVGQK